MLVLEGYGTIAMPGGRKIPLNSLLREIAKKRAREIPPVSLPVSLLRERARKRAREARIYQPACKKRCEDVLRECLVSCRA